MNFAKNACLVNVPMLFYRCNSKELIMGIKEKNQEKILRMLRCHGTLDVRSVMKSLALSEASVRRYFSEMEHSGAVLRYHGGIRPAADKSNSGYHFNDAVSAFTAAKHLIGITAARLIEDHDRLFFDSGTTVMECGNALAELVADCKVTDLRIVTNSLAFASGFNPLYPVMLTGGLIRSSRRDLCGTAALETVCRYNFTKAVMGSDAISDQGVLSATDEETSALAAAVIARSRETLILADSSKLGKNSFVPFGALNEGNITLITDEQADQTLINEFRRSGIKVIIAGE